MIDISADVEYGDWDRAMVALQSRLWRATATASRKSIHLVERNVKFYLRTYTHRQGEPTNSPPGGPPALVTGNLARSWRTVPLHGGADPWTMVTGGGPTAVYARIQELGGVTGRGYRTTLPRRPYVRPMMLVSRRGIRTIYLEEWTDAIRAS